MVTRTGPRDPAVRPTRAWIALLLALVVAVGGCAGESGRTLLGQPMVTAGWPSPGASGAASPRAPASASAAAPLASPDPSAPPAVPSVGPSPGPTADPLATTLPFDPATQVAFQHVLDAARLRIPTPGISVAIRLRDGRTWLGVSGERRLAPARPVDSHTVFSIASITKTFVTALVMQLVAEGRLDLDARASRYLPDVRQVRRATVRQLLAHTSGIQNYFETPRYNRIVFARPTHRWTFREIMSLVGTPYCAPGRCFHYSNTNFVLLGRIVERVTGKPIATVIRQRLLDPLGLDHTFFQPDEPTPGNAAHGHLWAGGTTFFDQTRSSRILPTMSAATVAWTAGALASDPDDLARWALALYATDRIVRPDLLQQMLTFRKRDEYGLGTRTRIFNGRRAVGHGGSLRGYENGIWYFPREGAVIVLLSNRGLYDPDRTIRQLARSLWKHIDAPAPEYDVHKNTD